MRTMVVRLVGLVCLTALLGTTSLRASSANPGVIYTGIRDMRAFLEQCPTADPVYDRLRRDFEFLENGTPITTPITCSEPISSLPISQLTDELIALQVLRTAYYMGIGTQGHLPWTAKGLYDWMASRIAGINFKTAPGQLYCCDVINGKFYFSTSRQDATQREFKRTWRGISGSLDFYAHEIRHADSGAPGHTTGCPAFPQPTGPVGCDATYDLSNLGSYGVQYWLESSWATGYLNIGIGCAPPATASDYAMWNAMSANGFGDRFVTGAPPVVTATQPYGGACIGGPPVYRATTDFNGDARSDLLWRNVSTGQTIAWLMGDLTWPMSSEIATEYAWLPTSEQGWQVVGLGDLNADGNADLVWRNTTTGQNSAWLMNGGAIANYAWLPTVTDQAWVVNGIGDLDGDGKADLVWRNFSTGDNIAWLMNGSTLAAYAWLPAVANFSWRLVALADLDRDLRADLVWRNTSTGQESAWLMDGGTVKSYLGLTTVADQNWQVVSPSTSDYIEQGTG